MTTEQYERNKRRHRIYKLGDIATVAKGDVRVTAPIDMDDEGDLYVPHVGALTNIYGFTMDDDGWQIESVMRKLERENKELGDD